MGWARATSSGPHPHPHQLNDDNGVSKGAGGGRTRLAHMSRPQTGGPM